jgi:G:T-mismatch repair DNA endonuclease (very short patch repair protein)
MAGESRGVFAHLHIHRAAGWASQSNGQHDYNSRQIKKNTERHYETKQYVDMVGWNGNAIWQTSRC